MSSHCESSSFVMVDEEATVETTTTEMSLKFRSAAEKSVVTKDTKTVTVGATIEAGPAATTRPPVDVVTVTDRSGSMSGKKMELCKETQKLLIGELKADDRFGLVSFDTHVKVEVPFERVGTKETQMKIIEKMRAGATTNLSGGLFKGLDLFDRSELPEDATEERVRALLLLTDGIANVGISDPDALVSALGDVLGKMSGVPPAIFTFGYGSDTNAKVLQQLAEKDGKGGYYFIDSTDRVVGAFADCLGGLLSVVAQTVVLDVHVDHGTISRIRRDTGVTKVSETHYTVDLGDVYAEEQRDVIIEVTPSGNEEVTCDFTLKYVDVLNGAMAEASTSTSVLLSNDVSKNTTSEHVMAQVARLDVADALTAARDDADAGRFEKAQFNLKAAKSKVAAVSEVLPAHGPSNALLKRLNFDLDAVAASSASAAVYQARGRHEMSSKAMGHQMQRCMSDSDSDGEEEDGEQVRNQYRNASKKAMKSRWTSRLK